MKKILFSLVILTFAGNVAAQTDANVKKPSIALKVSAFDFTTARAIQVNSLGTVLNNKSWEKLSNSTKSIGVQYFKGVTPKMDFMVNLDFASLSYPFYASSLIKNAIGTASGATTKGFYAAADAGLNFKMLSDDHKVVPYLSASIGVGKFRSNYMAYAPVGAGIQIKVNNGSFVNILSTFRAEMSALTKTHFNHGVSYSMPLKLKEKKPVVLPPPPPPADTDNDGVIDADDKCPTVAGLAKYAGCPIPDTDKDGINDEQDKCPTVAGLSRYNGCPIPDTDKDGVNDELDQCPTVAGIASNNGCEDLQPKLDNIAAALKFETGQVNIATKSLQGLDSLLQIMAQYPATKLLITGHTDNTGSRKINDPLSLSRAKKVQAYLVKKGLAINRTSILGLADTQPVASNETNKGRAQNRRVDLTIQY